MPSECLRELVERERGFITMLIAEPYFFLLATFPLHTSSSGFYSLCMLPGACAYRAFRRTNLHAAAALFLLDFFLSCHFLRLSLFLSLARSLNAGRVSNGSCFQSLLSSSLVFTG